VLYSYSTISLSSKWANTSLVLWNDSLEFVKEALNYELLREKKGLWMNLGAYFKQAVLLFPVSVCHRSRNLRRFYNRSFDCGTDYKHSHIRCKYSLHTVRRFEGSPRLSLVSDFLGVRRRWVRRLGSLIIPSVSGQPRSNFFLYFSSCSRPPQSQLVTYQEYWGTIWNNCSISREFRDKYTSRGSSIVNLIYMVVVIGLLSMEGACSAARVY